MKILILCTGNTCRSQMAHGFLQSFDNRIEVHSAGTIPGDKVNTKAVKVMAEAGVDIGSQFPREVGGYSVQEWDYVITVCNEAKESCPVFTGKVKNRLHMGYEDPSAKTGTEAYVMSEFRKTRDQIKRDFFNLYSEVIKPHLDQQAGKNR